MARWDDFEPRLPLPRKGNVFWLVRGAMKEIPEWLELGVCYVKVSVAKAILVVTPEGEEVWIPRSQIVDDVSQIKKSAYQGLRGLLCITEWFGSRQGW